LVGYIEIWGEYHPPSQTYQIGIRYIKDVKPLPSSFRLKGIWTIGALKECMKGVVDYCVENDINIVTYMELLIAE